MVLLCYMYITFFYRKMSLHVTSRSNSLGATRDTDTQKEKHIFVKSITSLLRSGSNSFLKNQQPMFIVPLLLLHKGQICV